MGRPRSKPVLIERNGQYFIKQGGKETDVGRSKRYAEKLLREMTEK